MAFGLLGFLGGFYTPQSDYQKGQPLIQTYAPPPIMMVSVITL